MLDQEFAIIESLEYRARRKVLSLVRWSDDMLDSTRYRLSVPAYTKPWYSGNRTPDQQRWFFDRDLSRCDGTRKRSAHQFKKAIHLGLRYRSNGRWIAHGTANNEPREVFLLVVRKAEQLGFFWGGRWRKLKDWHHFELRT